MFQSVNDILRPPRPTNRSKLTAYFPSRPADVEYIADLADFASQRRANIHRLLTDIRLLRKIDFFQTF